MGSPTSCSHCLHATSPAPDRAPVHALFHVPSHRADWPQQQQERQKHCQRRRSRLHPSPLRPYLRHVVTQVLLPTSLAPWSHKHPGTCYEKLQRHRVCFKHWPPAQSHMILSQGIKASKHRQLRDVPRPASPCVRSYDTPTAPSSSESSPPPERGSSSPSGAPAPDWQ
jgi:hypothetical protein